MSSNWSLKRSKLEFHTYIYIYRYTSGWHFIYLFFFLIARYRLFRCPSRVNKIKNKNRNSHLVTVTLSVSLMLPLLQKLTYTCLVSVWNTNCRPLHSPSPTSPIFLGQLGHFLSVFSSGRFFPVISSPSAMKKKCLPW